MGILFGLRGSSNRGEATSYVILTVTLLQLYYIMLLGTDILVQTRFSRFSGLKIALCTNYPVCDSRLTPTLELFKNQKIFKLQSIFAPEHGLLSDLQDQVVSRDTLIRKIPVVSLYGSKLSPPDRLFKSLDMVVIDLIDIGCRYYTFLWTAVLILRVAAEHGIKVVILDRPNPLAGRIVQGPVLEPRFSSFVGLYPIPIRHGLTIGELATLINEEFAIRGELEIVAMKGWKRSMYFHETGLPWTLPSPNMPSPETAYVYPGMCLLEGTNVSEGRGTTRPFELFGAPWIDPKALTDALNQARLPGLRFRPAFFRPTFHKFRGELCAGAQIVINDRTAMDPVILGLTVIRSLMDMYPKQFRWRPPPYERERKKMPFDILVGNSWIREALERRRPIAAIERRWQTRLRAFIEIRKKYLRYE
jgi:uncharacterized protein YbbC (DUF1343 family)